MDLIDYCHRQLSALLSGQGLGVGPVEEVESEDSGDEDGLPSKSKLVKVSLKIKNLHYSVNRYGFEEQQYAFLLLVEDLIAFPVHYVRQCCSYGL